MFFFGNAWAQTPPETAPVVEKTIQESSGLFHILVHADPLVKLVLLILIGFSVVSWAIIFYKLKQLKKAQKDSQDFWTIFSGFKSLQEAATGRILKSGPLYELMAAALHNLPRFADKNKPSLLKREIFQQKLTQVREEEIYKLEQYVPFLATTASTAPFIGLFGTVWGILQAFWSIGKTGSTSLAAVGPAISEALIATAVGLAAAIPAVVAYNFFVNKIKIIVKMMNLFQDEVALRAEEEQ